MAFDDVARAKSRIFRHMSPIERFTVSHIKLDSGCWQWTSVDLKRKEPYGSFRINGKCVLAHRFAYEHFVGPIPAGFQIDHLCRNKWCVNPEHLEPVTPVVNTRRADGPMLRARRERLETGLCAKGHPTARYWNEKCSKCMACHADRCRANYKPHPRQRLRASNGNFIAHPK